MRMRAIGILTLAILAGLTATMGEVVAAGSADPANALQPEASAGPPFDVLEYQVMGNSVLTAVAIERAVTPFLGPGRTIKDVERAREALEKVYHDAGYLTIFVDIPEQKVDEGVVELRVTEGKVARLRVQGSRYYSLGRIKGGVPALAEGTVPYFPKVQQELGALNRSPDRRVTPVLKPGRGPGTVDVDLKVDDSLPLHGSLELNNQQSPNTEPLRLAGAVRYDNLWQRDHSIGFNFQTSPQDTSQVRIFSGSYVLPTSHDGSVLALYAVDSKSSVGAVGGVTVLGAGRIFGAREVVPLASSERYFQSLTLGIDYKSFDQAVTLLGADTFNTPIKYTPMLLQYSGTQIDTRGQTQFNLGLNFAMRGFAGNRDEDFANKRFLAHANYAYLRADVQRTQVLPRGFSLNLKIEGQAAGQPLISNEQYSAGGADSVRGYLEAEQLGDNGIRGKIELHTPSVASARGLAGTFDEAYGLVFLEGAKLYTLEALPGQASSALLSSAGLGMRLKARKHVSLGADVAWPFKQTQFTEAREPHVHARLIYEF